MQVKMSAREQRIVKLAVAINALMRSHKDRNEAIDAYDMARVFFRKGTGDKGIIQRSSLALPTAP
jgi:hypothetical protein